MSDARRLSLALARLPVASRFAEVMKLNATQRHALLLDFAAWAHDGQCAPAGDWRAWLIRAGRGFGKTRAGAEWVAAIGRAQSDARIALVAATREDARRVMIEGESGLLSILRHGDAAEWRASEGQLRFASGAIAHIYSAARPGSLRGPQHHAAWCDELAKWRYGEAAWSNLLMGLRLGASPQVVVTTTPAPVPLMRQVMALPDCVETRGRTRDNGHLPDAFVQAIENQYGGTRLGRQELEGELIEDHEGALWTRALIEGCREAAAPALRRVVVAVDPPASADGDACGIVAAGIDADGIGHVLADASVAGLSPGGWAAAVAACAAHWGADRVVAEKNQGGDMVRHVLEGADAGLPVRLVHASRGKLARAEPVANLYEQGRVRHAGRFRALEDELCGLVTGGAYRGPGRSPDRADALVWGLTELLIGKAAQRAQVRQL
ncbi:DNA-packaging protein [uncultured Sphingomonas sp.]|uniref:DNA-packaging protein n=1 Tax=uncultured Sphingomonas sp. TaxID=158754 RepID=UPI0035CACB49